MRSALTVSLLLCVLLAGCSGVPVVPESPFQSDPTPPYESPNGTVVSTAHADALGDVRTVTRRFEVEHRYPTRDGEELTDRYNTTRHIDYTTDPPTVRLVRWDGRVVWMGTERQVSRSPDGDHRVADRYDRTVDDPPLAPFDFEGPEQVTRNGRTLYRYTAVRPESYYAANASGNVLAANVTLLVRPDGLIVERSEFVTDGTRFEDGESFERTVRYESVNDTTVERPEWYDDATADITHVTAPALNASLYTPELLDPDAGARPEVDDHGFVYTDNVVAPRVSCAPQVDVPNWLEEAELTIGYQDRYVPAGDEGGLTLYRYNDSYQIFLEVEGATVDTSANEVTAEIDESGYYAVLHTRTWEQLFDESEDVDAKTGVPDCG